MQLLGFDDGTLGMIVPVSDDYFPFTFCFVSSVVDLLNVTFL